MTSRLEHLGTSFTLVYELFQKGDQEWDMECHVMRYVM